MSQILFEQYKAALRRGHDAAMRGRLDAALVAYKAAAAIAPDRPLPHTSLGDVLRRLGRANAAEEAYSTALQLAPTDEAALRNRAAVRLELRRPVEAARDLELLAEGLEAAGRLPEACQTACDALEIAESRARRRTVERLAARLGDVDDQGARDALARAALFVDTSAIGVSGSGGATGDAPSTDAPDVAFDPIVARVMAESLMAAGNGVAARSDLLRIAAADRADGRLDAALDACFSLLTLDPADPAVQLEMAANHLARGWLTLAREKVMLLASLAELEQDGDTGATIRAFATDHGLDLTGGLARVETGAIGTA